MSLRHALLTLLDAQPMTGYKVHVYRELVTRARNEVEWTAAGLALVDRLETDAAGNHDHGRNPAIFGG